MSFSVWLLHRVPAWVLVYHGFWLCHMDWGGYGVQCFGHFVTPQNITITPHPGVPVVFASLPQLVWKVPATSMKGKPMGMGNNQFWCFLGLGVLLGYRYGYWDLYPMKTYHTPHLGGTGVFASLPLDGVKGTMFKFVPLWPTVTTMHTFQPASQGRYGAHKCAPALVKGYVLNLFNM